MRVKIMPDPHKRYGETRVGDISPTILGTDYKSPHLWIMIEER